MQRDCHVEDDCGERCGWDVIVKTSSARRDIIANFRFKEHAEEYAEKVRTGLFKVCD